MIKSYADIRAATQARDRSLREKVMSLDEAAKLVQDGDHVALGGCTLSRTPTAMMWALIRAGRKHLTLSRSIMSSEADYAMASGACDRIITSWVSQGIVWGISKVMRTHVESKRVAFEEWSHMSMGLRYRAGAMGVPFIPTRSMMGSDVGVLVKDQTREMTCPFTGDRLLLLPALNPDVALIHVQRCDPYGNAQIDGLPFMDVDIPMAANRVILTTERIVSNDQIRRAPDQTRIPFFTVDAVVEVPFGSAPHECYGQYEPFFKALDSYAEISGRSPVDGVKAYLDRHVYGPKTWNDYLALLGMDTLLTASRGGKTIYDV